LEWPIKRLVTLLEGGREKREKKRLKNLMQIFGTGRNLAYRGRKERPRS